MSGIELVSALVIREVRGHRHLDGAGREERRMDLEEGWMGKAGVLETSEQKQQLWETVNNHQLSLNKARATQRPLAVVGNAVAGSGAFPGNVMCEQLISLRS